MRVILNSVIVCGLIVLMSGCMTPMPEDGATFIKVRATADQKLILNGKKVDCSTFVKKAHFCKKSNIVILSVGQNCLATKATIKELVDHLIARKFDVSMKFGSKYNDLNEYINKAGKS